MSQWDDDCMKWRGFVLTGRYAHWCFAWDELPVDETTKEWPCECYRGKAGVPQARYESSGLVASEYQIAEEEAAAIRLLCERGYTAEQVIEAMGRLQWVEP